MTKDLKVVKNFIGGKFEESETPTISVYSPLNGEKIGETYLSGMSELDKAVSKAKEAQVEWGKRTNKKRSEVLYNYRNLLIKYRDELANLNTLENGKSLNESYGGIDKAIELTEFACSIPQKVSGEIQEVSNGVVCREEKRPLGVVASITPFNFPVMCPHWTVPNAIALGNAIILKPSELTPLCAAKMAEMWKEADLPDGIFSVVNGAKDIVEAICDHKDIKAISFVGSSPVAEIVYKRGCGNLKKVMALGGAKNHLIVTPDAHPEMAASDILASSVGMSGQRCMAASVLIAVGESNHIINKLVEEASNVKLGVDLPPLITKEAGEKIANYLAEAEAKGAKILVDGRKFEYEGNGYYFGPSVIDWRGTEHKMGAEEIFGPTLEILGANSIEEAIEIQNESPYGNASSIFTQNGRIADETLKGVDAGMLGVNIGVPVPREPFSFGGTKASKYGHGDITGKHSIEFWTILTKITTKWNPANKTDWMS